MDMPAHARDVLVPLFATSISALAATLPGPIIALQNRGYPVKENG
jgi:hypothetical protein